jgi:hypothetical protein
MSLSKKVMAGIERKTGLSSAQIKSFSPEELRKHLTKRTHKAFSVTSEFPKIGRGNVLRDGITSSADINRSLDEIFGV